MTNPYEHAARIKKARALAGRLIAAADRDRVDLSYAADVLAAMDEIQFAKLAKAACGRAASLQTRDLVVSQLRLIADDRRGRDAFARADA